MDRQTARQEDRHTVRIQTAFKGFQSWNIFKEFTGKNNSAPLPVLDKTTAKINFSFSASHGLWDKGRLEHRPPGPGAGGRGAGLVEDGDQDHTVLTEENNFYSRLIVFLKSVVYSCIERKLVV